MTLKLRRGLRFKSTHRREATLKNRLVLPYSIFAFYRSVGNSTQTLPVFPILPKVEHSEAILYIGNICHGMAQTENLGPYPHSCCASES